MKTEVGSMSFEVKPPDQYWSFWILCVLSSSVSLAPTNSLHQLRIRLVDRNDSGTRRRIEQISLKICGLAGQIPSSYILSTGLSKSDETAFVAGGFADVYRGKYNETNVALKVVRVAGKKNIRKAHKAC